MRAAGVFVVLAVTGLAASSEAFGACCRNYQEFADACRAQGGIPSPNPATCSPRPSAPPASQPARSHEADPGQPGAAAAEAAAAAAAAAAADDRRRKEDAERQARFIRDRDAAAGTLKGSSGVNLKGGSAAAEPALRGSAPDLGMRDAVADTRAGQGSVSPAQARAWQQLNCAAFIMRHALAGVIDGGDYRNLRDLAGEASKVADGGRPSVQCNPAPPFPRGSGTAPDMEKLKQVQTQMIDKAQSIGTRMEQREAALPDPARKAMKEMQAAAPVAGAKPETDIERLRRVQLALNRVNETKLDGKTTTAIQQQEKDRAEMAKLLLVAEKIEKGNVDIGINLTEEPSARRSRAK
jgi:hypothetical protein